MGGGTQTVRVCRPPWQTENGWRETTNEQKAFLLLFALRPEGPSDAADNVGMRSGSPELSARAVTNRAGCQGGAPLFARTMAPQSL